MHAVVDALGNCLRLVLTPGEAADSLQLPGLLAALAQRPSAVVADKANDTTNVLDAIAQHHAEAIIPPKVNRLDQRRYDENLYADPTRSNAPLAASKKPVALPHATKRRLPPF